MPSVLTTQTTEVKIAPRLKTRLLSRLKVYADLRAQIKVLELAMDKEKAEIGKLREEVGVPSLALDGFKVTQVTNLRSTLNKQRLIEMGVSTEMLDEATETKPGRPYEKITCPGDKDYADRD